MDNAGMEQRQLLEIPFQIRKAKRTDIPAMTRLLKALFTVEPDFKIDEEKQQKGLEMLLRAGPNSAAWVAVREGHVVGMVTVQLVISTAEGGLCGWVEDMVVDMAHRGQGIGSALLRRAVRWVRRRKALRLQLLCDCRNVPALVFYRKQEWSQTSLTALRLRQ